jgi:hypothetical protein
LKVFNTRDASVLRTESATCRSIAGRIDALPERWIREAWTPQLSEPDKYVKSFGFYWQIRQDGRYEAGGAYGQSVTIYPKERLVIAVNSAGVDHHGIGPARWDLIAAIRGPSLPTNRLSFGLLRY